MLTGESIVEARNRYVEQMRKLYPDDKSTGELHVNIREGTLFVEYRP